MTIETLPGMPVTIERDVPAIMRDGTVLRADVYRPSSPDAVASQDGLPVLLARSPYDKRVNVSTFGNTHPAWYAAHGYMVVIQDCRGRYTSDGDFYPFANETSDGYDTVEWVTLHPATTATDTDFTARLCVVDPDGRSVNLQEGVLRARDRRSLSEPEPLVPGEVYELRIDLGPIGACVPAGSRLRLDISSSDFPQWDRNLNSGGTPLQDSALVAAPATQTLLHNAEHPTRITLPVRRAITNDGS